MKIFGILLTKNEGDILQYTLKEASKWCDRIFVYDNGSKDESWSIVQAMAGDVIVPFKREDTPFKDGLRAEVFNAYREEARDGDWWCRLDSDEVYIDNPRAFLQTIPRHFHCVWSKHLQYYFTNEDGGRFDTSNMDVVPKIDANNTPVHYAANFSEQRFFKHRRRLTWNSDQSWPRHVGVAAPDRIRVKHFQWRSPQQIQVRLDTRREATKKGWNNFPFSLDENWRSKLKDTAGLECDRGDGNYIVDETALDRHLEPAHVRAVKLILHGLKVFP